MLPEWVQDCWELCQKQIIKADSEKYHKKYKVPLFHDIGFTSTGIVDKQKDEIAKLIKKHGGKFFNSFKSENIDILILERNQTSSEKFKAAIKCKKNCLTPKWIIDSVANGYALPIANYRVEADRRPKLLISTPEIDLTTQPSFNCTNISAIDCNSSVNETIVRKNSILVGSDESVTLNNSYKVILANMTVKQAKEAGPFLDGCNVRNLFFFHWRYFNSCLSYVSDLSMWF